MNTTIDIPDALFRQAKIRAAERGVTLKSLLIDALERGVAGVDAAMVEEPSAAYAAPVSNGVRPISSKAKGANREAPPGFYLDESGFPVLKRKPGDTTVITNEMINKIRDEEGV